jgi:propanediol utilization protein
MFRTSIKKQLKNTQSKGPIAKEKQNELSKLFCIKIGDAKPYKSCGSGDGKKPGSVSHSTLQHVDIFKMKNVQIIFLI